MQTVMRICDAIRTKKISTYEIAINKNFAQANTDK